MSAVAETTTEPLQAHLPTLPLLACLDSGSRQQLPPLPLRQPPLQPALNRRQQKLQQHWRRCVWECVVNSVAGSCGVFSSE